MKRIIFYILGLKMPKKDVKLTPCGVKTTAIPDKNLSFNEWAVHIYTSVRS